MPARPAIHVWIQNSCLDASTGNVNLIGWTVWFLRFVMVWWFVGNYSEQCARQIYIETVQAILQSEAKAE